jgi:O-antigen/teichoic acid export membrane protein
MLSAWRGDVAAGQYGAAYKLWEALGMVPSSLLDALFPEMARLAGERQGPRQLRSLLRLGGPLLTLAGTVLSIAGAALAPRLLPLVFGRAMAEAESIAAFRILVWAIPAVFLYLLSGHILYALGHQRRVTAGMLVVALVNVGLNVLVIPRWGTRGVSGVALLTAWLLSGILLTLAWQALSRGSETQL